MAGMNIKRYQVRSSGSFVDANAFVRIGGVWVPIIPYVEPSIPTPPGYSYLADPYYSDPVAFEGAMGYGAKATGGRGTGVPGSTNLFFVDNLNDSGAGSLRTALTASGKRVIVPRVSGYVQLASRIEPTGDFTFLGQLAPGGGLAIRPNTLPKNISGYLRIIGINNVIVRYLTVRSGENLAGYTSNDCVRISSAGDVIIDHLSASFGTDGLLDVSSGSQRVTVQNSLLSYALEYAGHPETTHGYATLITDSSRVSMLYNLINGVRTRVPELKGTPLTQWIGNVIYNYKDGAVVSIQLDNVLSTMDFRRNTYKPGPWTGGEKDLRFRNRSGIYNRRATVFMERNGSRYVTDESNMVQQQQMARVLSASPDTDPADPRVVSEWVSLSSVGTPDIIERTRAQAYDYVLVNAGNNQNRDALDARAVSQTIAGTGLARAHTSVADAGGYPSIAGGSYPAATDGVISDAWRAARSESRNWYEIDTAGTKRMIIENYADDVAMGRFVP